MDEATIREALDTATIDQLAKALASRCDVMLCRLEKKPAIPTGGPGYLSKNFLSGSTSHLLGMCRELQMDLEDGYRASRRMAMRDHRTSDGDRVLGSGEEPA